MLLVVLLGLNFGENLRAYLSEIAISFILARLLITDSDAKVS